MKKLTFAVVIVALLACTFLIVACDGSVTGKKINEDQIKAELANSDGTLDGVLSITQGDPDNVTAFNYVLSDIYASGLKNKSYMRKAIEKNSSNITIGELKALKVFMATMNVDAIFDEHEDFETSAYIEEMLEIICDGKTKTINGWTISASINQTADSITIRAVREN